METKFVLVADDYDDAAALLAAMIAFEDRYECRSAKDGVEALDIARAQRPDAVILDVDMPRIGGIEAARQLRSMFGERRPLLIAATGGSFDDVSFSGMFDHVLRKPFDFDALLGLLAQG